MNEKIYVLNQYTVHLGINIFTKLAGIIRFQNYSKIFLIIDEHFDKEWSNIFPKNAVKIIVPSGEEFKTLETVKHIWQKLLDSHADRKSLIINIGGGVVTDIGGFAASTYMRGVDFINVPTTLLSQVDASVGGKTGIDFGGVKNLIGTFNQPIAVICDIKFLETLPDREFTSGFGEIIKHGLIADKKYLTFVTSKKPREFTKKELAQIILESIKIKAKIVDSDEKEAGNRRLINFGHTIGHAIETLSLETSSPLLHGEAISIGMLAEAKLSQLSGNISDAEVDIVKKSLLYAGLPTYISNLSLEKLLETVRHDKKSEGGKLNFTLLKEIGEGIINQNLPDITIVEAIKAITF